MFGEEKTKQNMTHGTRVECLSHNHQTKLNACWVRRRISVRDMQRKRTEKEKKKVPN